MSPLPSALPISSPTLFQRRTVGTLPPEPLRPRLCGLLVPSRPTWKRTTDFLDCGSGKRFFSTDISPRVEALMPSTEEKTPSTDTATPAMVAMKVKVCVGGIYGKRISLSSWVRMRSKQIWSKDIKMDRAAPSYILEPAFISWYVRVVHIVSAAVHFECITSKRQYERLKNRDIFCKLPLMINYSISKGLHHAA
ncbi:hypothetical protein FH972_026271 [Carpinus fangiana]|uniref:Uncharacterized protein n=1 Tax=Carpinus fangiana TaxID=176857 RepID=A0A5N6L4H6_9ROSI|nr:hypothetical protein FH972_026271 [Carpinus fangiana]